MTCSAKVNARCTFRWIDLNSGNVVSEEKSLNLTKFDDSRYSYQCKMTCPLRGDMCEFESDVIKCLGECNVCDAHKAKRYLEVQ